MQKPFLQYILPKRWLTSKKPNGVALQSISLFVCSHPELYIFRGVYDSDWCKFCLKHWGKAEYFDPLEQNGKRREGRLLRSLNTLHSSTIER
jgi:hypothetical protein